MVGLGRQIGGCLRAVDEIFEVLTPVWNAAIILGLGSLAWLAMDRAAPFGVVEFDRPPPSIAAGTNMLMSAKVRRDVERMCSVEGTNRMHFADGTRWEASSFKFSAQELAHQEARTPDRLRVSIAVPSWAAPGPAQLVTTRYYVCNVTHLVAPIEVMSVMPFAVVPARPSAE
jgi:hypothetical protein